LVGIIPLGTEIEMSDKIRNGKDVEDLVEVICTKMFFSDFVVRNPKYAKNDGLEKEAADLLVPFGKYLLAFQVKSKKEHKKVSEKTGVEIVRIDRVANDAVEQLKTIKRVIESKWLESLTTVKGFEIPFDSSVYENVIGIVIIDLIGEEVFSKDERTEFIQSYVFKHGMPIHVFMRDEFDVLSTELDTLPDFISYLEKRKLMIERGLLLLPVSILDFLAFYKTDPDELDRVLDNDIHLLLEDRMWENYQSKFSDVIKRRNELNKPSYLIDAIIDFLHTSVGFTLSNDITKELGFTGQGSLESYLATARELASLSRLERRSLGERLLRCLRCAENQEQSYSMIVKERDASAFLVLSMSGKRSKRRYRLYLLCAMAYCYLDLKKIIGIATEPLSAEYRSYDALGMKDVKFENRDDLVEQAKNFFSKPYRPEITEYKGRIGDA